MTNVENKIKVLIGDLIVQLTAAQDALEQANAEIASLKEDTKKKEVK